MTTTLDLPAGVQINAPILPGFETILTRPALELVALLHRDFEPRRQQLLALRHERAKRLDAGERPDFLPETADIRAGDWKIAPVPKALECRRVEITGPVDAKMVINAFNSGADSYMTDFEDSNSPLWTNQIQGQINIMQAIRRTLSFEQETAAGKKAYRLNDKIATLQVRPRGWHLDEKHVTVDGQRVHGGIFDFALFMFHNAKELLARGAGPYFYLPKVESHLEARLWNEVFVTTQNHLGIPARDDQGDGADRDHPRRVRDGRDPLGAARALGRPQRRTLGLHLQLHQEVQARQELLPRRPRQGDDDRAVHARLRAAAAEDLPPARRTGDRRHERADPDQERPGQERGGDGRDHHRQAARRRGRLRRRLGRAPRARRAGDEGIRRRARRPAEPVRQAEARGPRQGRRPARLPTREADHRGRACA